MMSTLIQTHLEMVRNQMLEETGRQRSNVSERYYKARDSIQHCLLLPTMLRFGE